MPVRWLAPETLTTLKFTLKTDVWAFGILCWEVFMDGLEPYPDLKAVEVKEKVKNGHRLDLGCVEALCPEVCHQIYNMHDV